MRALDSVDWQPGSAEKQGPGHRIPGTLDGKPQLESLLKLVEGERVTVNREDAVSPIASAARIETTAEEQAADKSVAAPQTDGMLELPATSLISDETRSEEPIGNTVVELSVEPDGTDPDAQRRLVDCARQTVAAYPASPEVVLNFAEPKVAEKNPNQISEKPWKIAAVEESNTARETAENQINEIVVSEVQSSRPKAAIARRQARELSPTELAYLVFNELRAFENVPERGFAVTIYGANPWNAMLTISPQAGALRDAKIWRERVQEIVVRLRRDFGVGLERETMPGK